MFEEICLVCGKHLSDDGRAYCSDDCQQSEISSPSISSSSSALSSPSIGYTVGGDVPALIPSALGSALRVYARRSRYPVSSSSTSSNSCSLVTDDEDDFTSNRFGISEYSYHESPDHIYDTASKSANSIYSGNPSSLTYARRPSGTNNHSTIPHLDRHQASVPAPPASRCLPRSVPISSSRPADNDDDFYSDVGFSSGDAPDTDEGDLASEKDSGVASKPKYTGAVKSRRSHTRGSLPACFSLLQTASPSKDFRSSPVSSSSGHTIARPSPPTPKLPFANAVSQIMITPSIPLPSVHSTPRGRRRDVDGSRCSRRSGQSSHSRSRSRSRRVPVRDIIPHQPVSEDPIDYWASASELPRRGRETVRRNSSPPPKALMGVEDHISLFSSARKTHGSDRSQSGSHSRARARGRTRVEDLGGIGFSNDAPGFGTGRSGLVDRGRDTYRIPL
ncbi:hypothetical protein JR316_0003370 [Psilocybe cubensis]|uniref:Uncharacterized protein n=2 Tax=Psilocybe cubensis TaxID=181762 RepID=A0ACB8H898_PSICU|nr:hypothetical protein JR316_0003370 [Psilocybe cubensis]KAH9483892.1 hypothetical protein JR316_0003370 [Psilocybe cubensis]